MYVKAQTAHVAFTEMASAFLTCVLYLQRNGCDDDYSVMSSRVSTVAALITVQTLVFALLC